MDREGTGGEVVQFPGHRLGTIAQTMAGFRGASAATEARRREDRVTVLEADVRGFDRVAGAAGQDEAERLLAAVADRAVRAVTGFGPETVSVSGDPTAPIVSAAFEGRDHCTRALDAATALRDAVDSMTPPGGPGFRACIGSDMADVVEASAAGLSFRSVGTVRMFAGRLREFAGPGQVFLSADAWAELAGAVLVRSVGHVRTNGGGETREAFCLLDATMSSGQARARPAGAGAS